MVYNTLLGAHGESFEEGALYKLGESEASSCLLRFGGKFLNEEVLQTLD